MSSDVLIDKLNVLNDVFKTAVLKTLKYSIRRKISVMEFNVKEVTVWRAAIFWTKCSAKYIS